MDNGSKVKLNSKNEELGRTVKTAKRKQDVLIIGAGITALVTAKVVADLNFEKITLVEAGSLSAGITDRPFVPQGKHSHLLLAKGQNMIEGLFPGFSDELDNEKIPVIEFGKSLGWVNPKGLAKEFSDTFKIHSFTRGFFESKIRSKLINENQVEILDNSKVTGFIGQPNLIKGVKINDKDELNADLVIDATGRNSSTPLLLEKLGIEKPTETIINPNGGYASAIFEDIGQINGKWNALYVQPAPPNEPTGGVILPIEGNRCIITLGGTQGVHPPKEKNEWLEFAKNLRTPLLYDAIKDAKQLSTEISIYRNMENRIRHYENVKLPENLFLVGDGVCAFNPVYGQGMTSGILAALEVKSFLGASQITQRGFDSISFQKRLVKVNAPLWKMATIEDARAKGVEGEVPKSYKYYQNLLDLVFEASTKDAQISKTMFEVMNVLAPQEALLGPKHWGALVKSLLRSKTSS